MKKEENLEEVFTISNIATSKAAIWERYDECEFCFQFDDEEPQVFASTDNSNESGNEKEITFTLSNIKGRSISFQHSKSGKRFKLFGREKADKGTEK